MVWNNIIKKRDEISFEQFSINVLGKAKEFGVDEQIIFNLISNCSAGEIKLLDIFSTLLFPHIRVIISNEGESNLDKKHINILKDIINLNKEKQHIVLLVSHNEQFLKFLL